MNRPARTAGNFSNPSLLLNIYIVNCFIWQFIIRFGMGRVNTTPTQ